MLQNSSIGVNLFSDIEEKYFKMKKEEELREKLDLSKIKKRSDGRCYIHVNRKQYIASDRTKLIDKLYNFYYGQDTYTMRQLFPEYCLYRRDKTPIKSKTLSEHIGIWKFHIQSHTIVDMPIKDLRPLDFVEYFNELTIQKELKSRRVKDIKGVFSVVLRYAIRQGIIKFSPLSGIDYTEFSYTETFNEPKKPYNLDEREKLLDYLLKSDNPYDLLLALDFFLVIRIGELKGLKWVDIKGKYLRIEKQLLEVQELKDDLTFSPREHKLSNRVKGGKIQGIRELPLGSSAKSILEKLKSMNLDSEFIFRFEGRPMTTTTADRHLKAACECVGVPYRSSHGIRFTSASYLYKAGIPLTKIQVWLGHTTLSMTMRYIKEVIGEENYEDLYFKALG